MGVFENNTEYEVKLNKGRIVRIVFQIKMFPTALFRLFAVYRGVAIITKKSLEITYF